MSQSSKSLIEDLLARADITIGGTRPWDVVVHNDKLYDWVLSQGSLGLGEAYMDGWWDAGALDQFFHKVLRAELDKEISFNVATVLNYLKARAMNLQRMRVFEVGEKHYDIGNDLYTRMLDKRLVYSCGYWKDAQTLDEAQEAKLDLVCRKLNLQPGQRILDIGSGWGSFITYAAEKYGVEAVGVTISKEQAAYANANRGDLPIETRLMDYQDLDEQFDHIISIGMFEHVGYKNYRPFMEKVNELLKDDGLFLLHTIGRNSSTVTVDSWIGKYIFPNGMLPSVAQIGQSIEELFVMEDWHNFGPDYDKTLMAWFARFDTAWPELEAEYGERFHRTWKYYLLACAGSFRARKNQLWQVVLSKKGVSGGYLSVR